MQSNLLVFWPSALGPKAKRHSAKVQHVSMEKASGSRILSIKYFDLEASRFGKFRYTLDLHAVLISALVLTSTPRSRPITADMMALIEMNNSIFHICLLSLEMSPGTKIRTANL